VYPRKLAHPALVLLDCNDCRKCLKTSLGLQPRSWFPFLLVGQSRLSVVGDSCERRKYFRDTSLRRDIANSTPQLIVYLVVVLLLSAISFGSHTALQAILSVSNAALIFSYIFSVGSVRLKRLRGQPLLPSRFSLGEVGCSRQRHLFGLPSHGICLLVLPAGTQCWRHRLGRGLQLGHNHLLGYVCSGGSLLCVGWWREICCAGLRGKGRLIIVGGPRRDLRAREAGDYGVRVDEADWIGYS
jgi:hypothetical protein